MKLQRSSNPSGKLIHLLVSHLGLQPKEASMHVGGLKIFNPITNIANSLLESLYSRPMIQSQEALLDGEMPNLHFSA